MSAPATRETSVPLLDPSHELPAKASPDSTGADGGGGTPGKRGPARMIIILLLLAAVGGFIYWKLHGNKAEGTKENQRSAGMADRPVPVAVEKAQQRPVPIYLTALGTVTAYNTVTLKSRVDGQIIKVNFTEGQHVRQGQLLIQIDPRPYQAAVDQAKGALTRDEANARLAQTQSNRYTALYQAGVVSREQEQTQQSTAGQSAGTLDADRAAVKAAQVNLSYTSITSPISGVVGLRQVDVGNIVASNSTTGLVVITQVQPISVIFTLPEDQLPQVFDHMHRGGKLVVEAWDRNNTKKIATGALLTVDNQIDTTTGTAKLKAVFPNSDESLYPNQFVNIRLILETRNNAITVPSSALQTASGGSNFVYVVDTSKPAPAPAPAGDSAAGGKGKRSAPSEGGSGAETRGKGAAGGGDAAGGGGQRQTAYAVHARPVKVDLTQGSIVVIGSGLKAGEVIVIDGQEKLKDNSRVNLRAGNEAGGGRSGPGGRGAGATTASPGGTPQQGEQHSNGAEQPMGSQPKGGAQPANGNRQ